MGPSIRSSTAAVPQSIAARGAPASSAPVNAVVNSANVTVSSDEQAHTASGPDSDRTPSAATNPGSATCCERSVLAVTAITPNAAATLTSFPISRGASSGRPNACVSASSTADQITCRKSEYPSTRPSRTV